MYSTISKNANIRLINDSTFIWFKDIIQSPVRHLLFLLVAAKKKHFDIYQQIIYATCFIKCKISFKIKNSDIQDKRSSKGILKIVHLSDGQNRC